MLCPAASPSLEEVHPAPTQHPEVDLPPAAPSAEPHVGWGFVPHSGALTTAQKQQSCPSCQAEGPGPSRGQAWSWAQISGSAALLLKPSGLSG